MQSPHRITVTLVGLLAAIAVSSPTLAQPGVATYEVTFVGTWSQQTHPADFPAGAHLSGLIGGTHNSSVAFWGIGDLASLGIKDVAERGSTTALRNEVSSAIDQGHAYGLISGGGINPSPGMVGKTFDIAFTHPRVTLVSMVAPSPDWFVGVAGLSLREDGQWLDEVVVQLDPYDAGTDSGATYTSPNQPTTPPGPISLIADYPFFGVPLGTFTFSKLPSTPYDRAGYAAEIPDTGIHDVTGTVTILDERTIYVERFTYDGTAPAVYFYLGQTNSHQSFLNGIPIGPELVRAYDDEALLLTLPSGQTLDGYGAISVWCEEFSVNFGSAPFVEPLAGDLNCDGLVDFGDINPFVEALTNPAGWRAAHPECPVVNGDINFDRLVDFGDINPFVGLLAGPR